MIGPKGDKVILVCSLILWFKNKNIFLSKGDRGFMGEKGNRGEPGEKGERGKQGRKGDKGIRGYDGLDAPSLMLPKL